MSGNVIIYDWLSFTVLSPNFGPHDAIECLGLELQQFDLGRGGAHGYQEKLWFDGISIHYNNNFIPGVWIEMCGTGCRSFEDNSRLAWSQLFHWILTQPDTHVTRLDVALDDHTGILDLSKIIDDVKANHFISKWRSGKLELGFGDATGTTIYFGSAQSNVRLRIYDKASERGLTDGSHWIRVEIQLRDERAEAFMRLDKLGTAFRGVLANYLRFVVPSDDSNKSRWPTASYWDNILESADAIQLYTAPGSEYNIACLDRYVFGMAGSAIDAAIQCYGADRFIRKIVDRPLPYHQNPKYKKVVSDFRRMEVDLTYNCTVMSSSHSTPLRSAELELPASDLLPQPVV